MPAGTRLTIQNGDLTIKVAGTVIDGLDVRGFIRVQAPNVTIKNSIVRGRVVSSSPPLIENNGGYANLKIIDTEIVAANPDENANGIMGSNFTATRVNVHGVIDTFHLTGDNVIIEKSWIHDNLHYENDPKWGGKPSHDDSIQIQKGSNIRIDGNNISGAKNAGVMITQDAGKVANFSFTNNLADGGGCTVNIAEKAYGPIHGIVITDNKFGRTTKVVNCAIIAADTTKVLMDVQRNYYTSGVALVTVHRGA